MKKTVSLAIIISILLFSFQSLAESNTSLFWNRATALLDVNNNTLKNMAASEKNAKGNYNDAADKAMGINTVSTTATYMGMEMTIHYEPYVSMLLTQQKELLPEQMKLTWEMTRDSRTVTRNSLLIGLRGLYLGLYSADNDYKLKLEKLQLAQNINNQDKVKLQNGMISDIDKAESDYNLLKAQKDADAAKRSYDNMLRSFDSFLGISLDTKFDEIIYEEQYSPSALKQLDYYVDKGLAGRLDISGVEKQRTLLEKKKEIMDRFPLSLNTVSARKDYDNLQRDIESQKLKIEKAKLDVEKGIKDAYVEVSIAGKKVEDLKRTLDLQENTLESTKKKFQAGFISKTMLDQLEIGVEELENGYKAMVFDYNTKLMKLENAAGLGPAY